LALWPRCFSGGSTAAVRAQLAVDPHVDWVHIVPVEEYLRDKVEDGEVLGYAAATLPVYRDLGLDPPTRYIYGGVLFNFYPRRRDEIIRAMLASRQRYIVTDVDVTSLTPEQRKALPPDGECSPPYEALTSARPLFPWTYPVVFRSGRYLVHKARVPH